MNKWRKLLVALMVVAMVFALAACGGGSGSSGGEADSGSAAEESTGGDGQKYTIKLAGIYGDFMTETQSMYKFKEMLEEKSGGNITVEVYPATQLGSEDALIEGCASGSIEMICAGHLLGNYLPFAALTDHAFVFDNWKHAEAALNDPETLKKCMEGAEEFGLVPIGYAPSAFRQFFSQTEVTTMDGLKGLRARVTSAYPCYRSAELLGCNTVVLPMTEIITSLEQKVVDAVETPAIITHANKYDEMLKYGYLTDHMFTAHHWHMSKKFYDSLPEDVRTMIIDTAKECIAWDWSVAEQEEKHALQIMQDEMGMTITRPTEDEIAKMKELCAPMDDEVESQHPGSKDILAFMRDYKY